MIKQRMIYQILLATLLFGITSPLMSQTVWSVSTQRKAVAFTFDDGPKPEHALPLLDMLNELQIKATFFLVGQEIKNQIDIVKRISDQGHEVANHSYTHRRFPPLSPADMSQELQQTNALIRRATGRSPRFFRPPGGQFNPAIVAMATSHGLTTILWDVNAKDYTTDPTRFPIPDEWRRPSGVIHPRDAITEAILQDVKPGSIVLMHNGGDILRALPKIVSQLRGKGYEIVTVGELMQMGVPVSGSSHYSSYHVPD